MKQERLPRATRVSKKKAWHRCGLCHRNAKRMRYGDVGCLCACCYDSVFAYLMPNDLVDCGDPREFAARTKRGPQ